MKTFEDWWNESGMDSTTETFGKLTEDLCAMIDPDGRDEDIHGRVLRCIAESLDLQNCTYAKTIPWGKELKWTEVVPCVTMESSFGIVDKERNVEMECTLGFKSEDSERGYYEIYDTKTGGDRFYAEGGIWFNGNKATDYDGVFRLPDEIVHKLRECGADTKEIEV